MALDEDYKTAVEVTNDQKKELSYCTTPDAEDQENHDREEEEYHYISGPKLWLVLAALTLVYFLIMLDQTVLATV
jgi:hypothetical protein